MEAALLADGTLASSFLVCGATEQGQMGTPGSTWWAQQKREIKIQLQTPGSCQVRATRKASELGGALETAELTFFSLRSNTQT